MEEFQLNDAYLEMLVAVQHSSYFYKCLRTQSLTAALGGNILVQAIGQRLVALGPTWNGRMLNSPLNRPPDYIVDLAANVLRLFSTLLATFVKELDQATAISLETKTRLQPWLRQYPTTLLGDASMRSLDMLSGNSEYFRGVNRFVRRGFKNWKVCAMPNCEATTDPKADPD
jgi:hypothetical protein